MAVANTTLLEFKIEDMIINDDDYGFFLERKRKKRRKRGEW